MTDVLTVPRPVLVEVLELLNQAARLREHGAVQAMDVELRARELVSLVLDGRADAATIR